MIAVKVGATWTPLGPVGGTWLHVLGPVGEIKWTRGTLAGCKAASWAMALSRGFSHPDLRRGALVELYDNGYRFWLGVLAEPDVASWAFSADGIGMQFPNVVTLTSDPAAAAAAAVARGWRFTVDASVPAGVLDAASDDASQVRDLAALLNEVERRGLGRWGVDEDGRLAVHQPATTVTWHITPGVPAMATADDDYASTYFGRYISDDDPLTHDVETAGGITEPDAERWGPREAFEDLTSHGVLLDTEAEELLEARLADNAARPGFTQGVEVTRLQITTPGGIPARPSLIREGDLIRHHGVYDVDGRYGVGQVLEWEIGEVQYDTTEPDRIVLTPVGLVDRTTREFTASLTRLGLQKTA